MLGNIIIEGAGRKPGGSQEMEQDRKISHQPGGGREVQSAHETVSG